MGAPRRLFLLLRVHLPESFCGHELPAHKGQDGHHNTMYLAPSKREGPNWASQVDNLRNDP